MLDFSRCRLTPFAHQKEDVQAVIDHPYYFIASEMRTGKSAIIVWAAQFLFEAGKVDKILVVAPAPVRDVWQDKTLGEFAKHLWPDVPAIITEFHARIRTWQHGPPAARRLEAIVTNFEFIRAKNRLIQLLPFCGPKTMLVLDESSFVKNYAAQQTKACMQLRKACGRVYLLNGTPLFHSPLDLFSQGNLLSPSILDCKYITLFKARYAIQEVVRGFGGGALTNPYGKPIQRISGWTNLEDLQARFSKHTVRRLQKTCLDLPPKLDPVMLTATLTDDTWRAYKNMRDDLVVWLANERVATGATAAVKVMRLAQITSGFVGGIEDAGIETVDADLLENIDLPGSFLDGLKLSSEGVKAIQAQAEHFIEVGREKLDVLHWFIGQMLEKEEHPKIVVWCKFRVELERVVREVTERWPQFQTATLWGGQKKAERLAALALLKPETSPDAPVFVGGTFGTGSFGLDMTAAHTSITMSSDYSPGRHAQAADRVYGPGQTQPIAYFEIVAVGPKNQKTIDHAIIAARRSGEDVAQWTSSAWVKALEEE